MGKILKYNNIPITLKTCINSPNMRGRTVLVENRWDYVRYYLNSLPRGKRKNLANILFFWNQAEEFYNSSRNLSITSSPLPLYYSFLNATKALLLFKNEEIKNEYHGVKRTPKKVHGSKKCSLCNETTEIKSKGICPELAAFLGDKINNTNYTLDRLLFNLVFIHRAYTISHNTKKTEEMFLPLNSVRFERKPDLHITLVSEVDEKYRTKKVFETFNSSNKISFDKRDNEYKYFSWKKGPKLGDMRKVGGEEVITFHKKLRRYFQEISAGTNSRWYFKNFKNDQAIDMNPLVVMFLIMHTLSELARYDPKILNEYIKSEHSWLLSEFISFTPFQYINGIASEITGEQLGIPRSPQLNY
ncbi:hypothetical protein JZO70_08185 [Enterococcus sp. 669A]|uniref:Uncharacterized protein n=1 Tax=Candidatus Enterococcus moelleringii TaxID=2815325 RepID=A0ABS3LBM1_9ENTE|nr:YaaC family protein [Enterococcus sp. 669A]MBO1306136.1 hypothetical protein [Enterococcus sp. 669A]